MRSYPWGKLPACLFGQIHKLEAYATVRNQTPLAQQTSSKRRLILGACNPAYGLSFFSAVTAS